MTRARPGGVVVVVLGLGVLLQELGGIGVACGGHTLSVPRPVEHGQGLVLLGVAHIGVGHRNAAQAVGEDPGVGHDLMGVQEAVRGDLGLGRQDVVAADGVGALAGEEGLNGGLGEVDPHLPVGLGLGTIHVGKALTHGDGGLPDTHLAADGRDGHQVLARGLLVEGELIEGVILGGIEHLLGDRLAGDGFLKALVPFVEGQSGGGIRGAPGRHGDLHAVEGSAVAHADTVDRALGDLLGAAACGGG